MAIWLLWGQLQIGRVLLFGASASGTVVSVHQCSRVTVGNVIIVFADAHGNLHRETHSSYTPGCFVIYHEGETVTVRYVPSDPGVLMTQPELDSLWISVLIFGMGDVLFLGGGGAAVYLFVLPWVASRVSALRAQERM